MENLAYTEFSLRKASHRIFTGEYRGKRYIAGDFKSKSSFMLDYYKEGREREYSPKQHGPGDFILGDEKVALTIFIEDEDSNWSAVHYSPKDLISITLSVRAEGDVFKRLYLDRYNSVYEEEITIR